MLLALLTACLTSSDEYAELQDQLKDKDADGYLGRDDCDDTSASAYPGGTEIPGDGLDNDCDPSTADALPPVQPLSGTISASALAHVEGPGAYYAFGQALALEDLSGDGVAEVLVGAPRDRTAGVQAGAVYIFDGVRSGSQPETALYGSPDELFSAMNVGATIARTEVDGRTLLALATADGAGGCAILLVPYPPDAEDVTSAAISAFFIEDDPPQDLLRWSASDDWLVTSDLSGNGAVYGVVPSFELVNFEDEAVTILEGAASGDQMGASLAKGDMDGDGQDELLAGAPGADGGTGRVYVARDLGTGDFGLELWLGSNTLGLGAALATGDVNGDGHTDFAATTAGGALYLALGPSHGGEISSAEHELLDGGVSTVSLSSDLDADGDDDLSIGRPELESGGDVRVFYELASAALHIDDAALIVEATNPQDLFGYSLAGGADVDGDGDEDLVIGAPEALGANARSGAIYLIPGGGD